MEKNWKNTCLWMGLGIDLEGTQGTFQGGGNILEPQRDLIFTFVCTCQSSANVH